MSHNLRAGDLNRRITIQQRSSTPDSYGQQSGAWTDVVTCWAGIEPLTGRELLAAQAVNTENTHQVKLRYRTGITAAMRVVYQGRLFNILSVIDPDTAHVALHLLCSEGLTQG